MKLAVNDNLLHLDGVSLVDIADQFGTPTYVYSYQHLQEKIRMAREVFEGLNYHISFAMKANNNLYILKIFREMGLGADAVSMGEMLAAQKAGYLPNEIILNGNGKTDKEIAYAIQQGIFAINVDSYEEFDRIRQFAQLCPDREIRIFLRLNPDIDPKTHPYISTGLKKNKFGMEFQVGTLILQEAVKIPNLKVIGTHFHIGSQLLDHKPYVEAIRKISDFFRSHRRYSMPFINLGGGWGIDYHKEGEGFPLEAYRQEVIPLLSKLNKKIILELGRYLVSESCFLLGKVLGIKSTAHKNFVITDMGMNDLIRPTLYQAYHFIEPVENIPARKMVIADIVGPLCETGDKIAENYPLKRVEPGEHLVVYDVGAYGYSMVSNYNLRPHGAEVLVRGGKVFLIRPRQTYEELFSYYEPAQMHVQALPSPSLSYEDMFNLNRPTQTEDILDDQRKEDQWISSD